MNDNGMESMNGAPSSSGCAASPFFSSLFVGPLKRHQKREWKEMEGSERNIITLISLSAIANQSTSINKVELIGWFWLEEKDKIYYNRKWKRMYNGLELVGDLLDIDLGYFSSGHNWMLYNWIITTKNINLHLVALIYADCLVFTIVTESWYC